MISDILPRFGKIAIVDNKHQEVEIVEQLLAKHGASYVFYDYNKLIADSEIYRISGIRLLFLDIRLEEGNEEPKNMYSVLASTVETIVGTNNGPYIIVLWTNEYQQKDEVKNYLFERLHDDETTKPTYICALDKKDFSSNPDLLFEKIKEEMDHNRPLEFLSFVEGMTMDIPNSLSNMLLQSAKSGEDIKSINKLLMLLASVESTEGIDEVRATKNILYVISELVKDRYMEIVSNDDFIKKVSEYIDIIPNFDPNNVQVDLRARINTAFNVNLYGAETDRISGKVYKTNQIDDISAFDKSTFGKIGKQTRINNRVDIHHELVKVDITPGCDYAQDKAMVSTYVYGYLIYIDKVDNNGNKEWISFKNGTISNVESVYFTPCFMNGDDLCLLLVNTKWIRFEKIVSDQKNYLFRLNDALTSDIRKTAADNIARVGIPCV